MSERIKERRDRIALLRKMVDEAGDKPIKKVLAQFCVDTGITEFTARRYLRLLIDAGLVPETANV